ncbi:MAG: hypothetical protein M1834_008918 [Cirrosporium novae-zelandiae]|nr:MAG: hypothetical protein M1834_008918 [Cirrosporium novae-zelandiae]
MPSYSHSLPPFRLRLPLPQELEDQVIFFLRPDYPTLFTLRQLNHHYYTLLNLLIKNPPHPWTRRQRLSYLVFEESWPLLTPLWSLDESEKEKEKEKLYCYTCIRKLAASKFSDVQKHGKRARGGTKAASRFCIECGVQCHRYGPGEKIVVDGVGGLLCGWCGEFKLGDEATGEDDRCRDCTGELIYHRERMKAARLVWAPAWRERRHGSLDR